MIFVDPNRVFGVSTH